MRAPARPAAPWIAAHLLRELGPGPSLALALQAATGSQRPPALSMALVERLSLPLPEREAA